MSYHELSLEERSNIQVGLLRGMSQRAIARMLNRSPSTICREIRRNRGAQGEYITQHAQRATCERRMPCRPQKKLMPGVIPPFLVLARSRGQAARANFCLGVMPPRAMFGRS